MADSHLPTGKPADLIRHDLGGWISRSIDQHQARHRRPSRGKRRAHRRRHRGRGRGRSGTFSTTLSDGRGQSVAIGWRAGSSRGLPFRKTGHLRNRVAGEAVNSVVGGLRTGSSVILRQGTDTPRGFLGAGPTCYLLSAWRRPI